MAVIPIDPKTTSRAQAWELWMQSPMPMVTITKTFDVSRLVKLSKKENIGFNILLCYVIAKAASTVSEFYMLPVNGELLKYDTLGINVIVKNKNGGLGLCDVPFYGDLHTFIEDYNRLTAQVIETSENIFFKEGMIIGTSALTNCEIDSIQNQYSKIFNNPFLAWGKYRKGWFKTTLPISFQFHHVQMDGGEASVFLMQLQHEIDSINYFKQNHYFCNYLNVFI